MKKNIIKILWILGMYCFILSCFAPIAHAIDGSNLPATGEKKGHLYVFDGQDKGVCDNCHVPHGAAGEKIWSEMEQKGDLEDDTVKSLCGSCHYSDVSGWNGIITSGRTTGDNGNVFLKMSEGSKETQGANHVMGFSSAGAGEEFNTSKAKFDKEVFPFDETEGFYCGSCHDPHKQPNGETNGDGDYLRTVSGQSVGTHNDRKDFCRQCHLDDGTGTIPVCVHTGINPDPKCYDCHRVHDAYKYEDPNNDMQDLIFVDEVVPQDWFQSPPGTCFVDSKKYYESQACINCHTAPNPEETWENAPRLPRNRMHHYNGRKWAKTSCVGCHPLSSDTIDDEILDHLDGYEEKNGKRLPAADRVFSCTSCHSAHSEKSYSNFLRFANFKEDATNFCEYCHASCEQTIHSPKTMANLSANSGKHFKTQTEAQDLTSPITRTVWYTNPDTGVGAEVEVGCGGCMLCHFIHPKESDMVAKGDTRVLSDPAPIIRTDLQPLMRVPAVILAWDEEANQNTIPNKIDRYEALCNGCHSNNGIVGPEGKDGSLLDTSKFSHRFACFPDSTKNPYTNITTKMFHQSDGVGLVPNDDYGTTANQIYCGTCHDVHNNSKSPYLALAMNESSETPASPYVVNNEGETGIGLCEQCHCTETNLDPMNGTSGITHPVGDVTADRNIAGTVTNFPEPDAYDGLNNFWGGGSGTIQGVTANENSTAPAADGGGRDGTVICLTCHNIHAATTSWNRKVGGDEEKDHGPLCVRDNFLLQSDITINSEEGLKSDGNGSDMCRACHTGM